MLNLLDLEKKNRTNSSGVFLNCNEQINTNIIVNRSDLRFYGASTSVKFFLPVTYVELLISARVFVDTGQHASSL